MTHRRRPMPGGSMGAAWVIALVCASTAFAQNPHEGLGDGSVADVPPGNAAIVGQLTHPDGAEKTEGSTLVLYSLAADGSPGMRTLEADARGTFTFEDLSNASGITYLIGASYRGVPYGKRVVFQPGQQEIALVIEVDDPVSDTSRISVGASSLRVEWIGASLGIEEIHQLENPAPEVVYVPKEERADAQPAFRTRLPDGATGVDTSLSGVAEGYEVRDGELRFWGPVYEGGLELRFRYLLPIPREREGDLAVRWRLDSGSRDATVLFPPDGPRVSIAGVAPGPDVDLGEVTFESLDLGPMPKGRFADLAVSIPDMSTDTSAISISRTDVWIDTDDTFTQVNVEVQLRVAPGAHLTGTSTDPLLTFDLPAGAELLGLSPEAQSAGLIPLGEGNLGVVGPLSPGPGGFAFRYRFPVQGGKPHIDLVSPAAVGTLNVLIADNGVIVDTDRLHRRRPFRQGTRVYLHREAFAIEAGEVIPIGLELIDHGALHPNAHLFATSALAALGVWFMVTPLTRRQRSEDTQYEQARIRSERDIVYQSIRDLEHDFETAKIEADEYEVMREELRARGLALLQRERDTARAASQPDRSEDRDAPAKPAPRAPAKFCVACGEELQSQWRFCASCGAATVTPGGDGDADA